MTIAIHIKKQGGRRVLDQGALHGLRKVSVDGEAIRAANHSRPRCKETEGGRKATQKTSTSPSPGCQ